MRTRSLISLLISCLLIVGGADALAQPQPAPKPTHPRLATELSAVVDSVERGATAGLFRGLAANELRTETMMPVTIRASDPAAVIRLVTASGGTIANTRGETIEAYVRPGILRALAHSEAVDFVTEIRRPQSMEVISQGRLVHDATPWIQGGLTGAGVKLGIIDVGFSGISALLGVELPANVVARCYTSLGVHTPLVSACDRTSAHGTAVAESAFDIAPGVQLYVSNPQSKLDVFNAVVWMVANGVQVINYSVGWAWDGPGDGTSPYSDSPLRAVDYAVAGGAIFVNSAGNAQQHNWFGPGTDIDADNWLEFSAAGELNRLHLVTGLEEETQIALRWQDTWGGATRDLDLYIYDSAFNVVASSQDYQTGAAGAVPSEWLSFRPPVTGTYYVSIKRASGSWPGWIQLQGRSIDSMEVIRAQSIGNPAESANSGMLAVGAAAWNATSTLADYSSIGPTPDGRVKPDIVGAASADTVSYGAGGFQGTSQASPHVAGLAALVKQAFPSYTPTQIANYLKAYASPRGAVPNSHWGYGFALLPNLCAYTLTPTSVNVGAGSVNPSVTVSTTKGCSWSATSNAAWITLPAGAIGTGSGSLQYTVAANASASRVGTITIANQTFTVSQAGGTTFTVTPLSWNAPTGGGSRVVTVTSSVPGASWAASSGAAWLTVSVPGGTGSGSVTLSATANTSFFTRVTSATIAGQSVVVTQFGSGTATVALNATALQFAAINTGSGFGAATSAQPVRLSQTGAAAVGWTAQSNQPWLRVSPASGSGPATLAISTQYAAGLPMAGTATGTITLTFTGATQATASVAVSLRTIPVGGSARPIGIFDTPAHGTTGVTGSVAVTGWALDDIEVTRVRVFRSAAQGTCTAPIFIGDAVLVDGARADVAGQYATYPRSTRAGWGYMMLTNFLPDGLLTLCAIAEDVEGGSTVLGVKTITVANAAATRPFGAIDTPAQGQTISGTNFYNFGWVLSPRGQGRADPPGGGTVSVFIDNTPVGVPAGWTSRSDIASLFPTFAGVNTAVGVYAFNPQALGEGVHSIAWSVTNSLGATDGIGSRYFTVTGSGSSSVTSGAALSLAAPAMMAPLGSGGGAATLQTDVAGAPAERREILARRGYDAAAPFRSVKPDGHERQVLNAEELDRIELQIGQHYTGYMRVGDGLGPLPIGSRLDPDTGIFGWQPGVGFIGRYDFVFVRWANGRAISRQEVRIVLHTKGGNLVGPQIMIDTPSTGVDVPRRFTIAGWALDRDDDVGTGVDTVHVWAYPLDGAAPTFLGVAAYGGVRPDVAGVHGERYGPSGYDLVVEDLQPGQYDLAVFAFSTARNAFAPAKVVRVTVR